MQLNISVNGVIETSLLALEVGNYYIIKTAVLSVPRRQEALRCRSVSPTAERGDERRSVPVRISMGNKMIAVPSIRYSFPGGRVTNAVGTIFRKIFVGTRARPI